MTPDTRTIIEFETVVGALVLIVLILIMHNLAIIEDRLKRIYGVLEEILQIYRRKDK